MVSATWDCGRFGAFSRVSGTTRWGGDLGLNLDQGELRIRRVEDAARFRRLQSERVILRALEIEAQTGRRPSLVGWSLGGLFAFDAVRRPSGES
jgi:hypothetical protein